MLLALVLNGICPFGLRILAGMGYGRDVTTVYLFYWYLAGFLFGIAVNWRRNRLPSGRALLLGLAMGIASVGGQLFMGLAMVYGAAGGCGYSSTT
jgi:hypothetical protein